MILQLQNHVKVNSCELKKTVLRKTGVGFSHDSTFILEPLITCKFKCHSLEQEITTSTATSLYHHHHHHIPSSYSMIFRLLSIGVILINRVHIYIQGPDGNDGSKSTLRSVFQQIEQGGTVEFDLAGHTFERPAEVLQAQEPDKLLNFIFVF